MSKWQKIKHRIKLAIDYRWFLSMEDDLKKLQRGSPSIIFDVGAHHGQTTLHFRKAFPSASIHSFEPTDENFGKLKANTMGKRQIQINKLALGNAQTLVNMDAGNSDLCHQVIRNQNEELNPLKASVVRMETIDSYIQKNKITRIDLLKIDVEGYELEVLDGAKDALASGSIKAILAECDFDPEDTQHTFFNDLWDYLRSKNFSFFGLYDVIHYGNTLGVGFCNALFIKKPVSGKKTNLN